MTNHHIFNDVQEMLAVFSSKGLKKGNDQNDWPEQVFAKNGWFIMV